MFVLGSLPIQCKIRWN